MTAARKANLTVDKSGRSGMMKLPFYGSSGQVTIVLTSDTQSKFRVANS
jgi:hypothetical protein